MVTEARPPVSLLSKPVPVVAWWMLLWDGSRRLVILDRCIIAKWSDEGLLTPSLVEDEKQAYEGDVEGADTLLAACIAG